MSTNGSSRPSTRRPATAARSGRDSRLAIVPDHPDEASGEAPEDERDPFAEEARRLQQDEEAQALMARQRFDTTPRRGGAPVPPEAEYAMLQELHEIAKGYDIPGLGDVGTIVSVVEEVDVATLELAPWTVRDDWDARDADHHLLKTSLAEVGQIEPLLTTTIMPDDPAWARNKRRYVFQGRRRLRIFRDLGATDVRIRTFSFPGGAPIPPHKQLELYLHSQLAYKQLSNDQKIRGALLYMAMLEGVGELVARSVRQLAEATHTSPSLISRANGIRALGTTVARAVLDGELQMVAVREIGQAFDDAELRRAALEQIIEENRRRRARRLAPLTIEEAFARATGRQYFAPNAPRLQLSGPRTVEGSSAGGHYELLKLLAQDDQPDPRRLLGAVMLDLKRILDENGIGEPDEYDVADIMPPQMDTPAQLWRVASGGYFDEEARRLRAGIHDAPPETFENLVEGTGEREERDDAPEEPEEQF